MNNTNSNTSANNTDTVKTFEERLAEARAKSTENITSTRLRSDIAIDFALRSEAVATMKALLVEVYETLEMDLEKLANKFVASNRSMYGRVPALLNILSATYVWPLEQGGDTSTIQTKQESIIELLNNKGIAITGEMLVDFKEVKGYNSFITDELEVVDGVEPVYDEYAFYVLTLADAIGLPYVDNKLTESAYNKAEAKTTKKIRDELEEGEKALAKYQALVA